MEEPATRWPPTKNPEEPKFFPPDLKVLKKPLGDPVDININWVVYNDETKKRLDTGAAQIQLTDNR